MENSHSHAFWSSASQRNVGRSARSLVRWSAPASCASKSLRIQRCTPFLFCSPLLWILDSRSCSAFISERLCIGCGICPKKCPFDAINIINLPTNLETQVTHRYSANSFKLHRLPMPRPGQVLGLVGTNGIGKSTALKILSGKLKPNLGRYDNPPDWAEILKYFRGSELQSKTQPIFGS